MLSDIESEKNVLAIMLNDEPGLLTASHELSPSDFYDTKHQALFAIITDLYTQSVKPTYMEVMKETQKTGLTIDLAEILDYYITSENLGYWLNNVKEKSKRRKLKHLLTVGEDALKHKKQTSEIISELETALTDLKMDEKDVIDTGFDIASLGMDEFDKAARNKGQLTGIHTGIGRLNRLTGGWNPEDVILLAAETGKGKTAFSLNFLDKACVWLKNPTLYVNSEMSKKQIAFRLGSILAGIKNEAIRFGECNDQETLKYTNAMQSIANSPFFHYSSPALEMHKVTLAIRKMKMQQDIRLVIVDYVGRMEKLQKDLKEWQVLEHFLREFKNLARELKIAIIVVAQLNDDLTIQGARRMENEVNVFLRLLPMTEEQKQETAGKYRMPPNYFIHIKKNRDGQADVYIPTYFEKETMKVVDIANV